MELVPPLGDPIEIGALDKDWIFSTSILATKTMFGHAESPAGLLSLAISASYFITEQKCTAHITPQKFEQTCSGINFNF